MSNSVRPHRRQHTRLPCPWDSPGKKEYWSGLLFPSPYKVKYIEISGIILILKVHSFWLWQKAGVWASSKALFGFASHPAMQSALQPAVGCQAPVCLAHWVQTRSRSQRLRGTFSACWWCIYTRCLGRFPHNRAG